MNIVSDIQRELRQACWNYIADLGKFDNWDDIDEENDDPFDVLDFCLPNQTYNQEDEALHSILRDVYPLGIPIPRVHDYSDIIDIFMHANKQWIIVYCFGGRI